VQLLNPDALLTFLFKEEDREVFTVQW